MAGKGGGGAWKVAYADFVTAMMAFFLVMWIVAQNKPVREAVAQYFNDPSGASSGRKTGGSGGSVLPLRKHGGDLGAKIITKGQRTRGKGPGPGAPLHSSTDPSELTSSAARRANLLVLHDGDSSTVGTTVPFTNDAVELDATGKERLSELVSTLRGKPNKIEIRGHATAQSKQSDTVSPDAWQLSYARCQATMRFLESKGIEPERFRLSQAGSFEPHTLKLEPGWRAENSRVEVYMLGEFVDSFKGTRKEREQRPGVSDETPISTSENAQH
ncbi:MAG: flagellar motor protein MotB [Planctomycetota bacterium]|nr:flagellar motor protein MotB [Planctomycetota bacterium]